MRPVIVNRSPTLTKTARVYASSGGRWLGQSRTLFIVCSSASHSGAADGAMFTCWGRTACHQPTRSQWVWPTVVFGGRFQQGQYRHEFGPPWSLEQSVQSPKHDMQETVQLVWRSSAGLMSGRLFDGAGRRDPVTTCSVSLVVEWMLAHYGRQDSANEQIRADVVFAQCCCSNATASSNKPRQKYDVKWC